jgi:hypothetical protein
MLSSGVIPQYEEDAIHWSSFIRKVAKGSAKATDMLNNAHQSYMVDLTGDPSSPATLNLVEYGRLFRERFPEHPPTSSHHELLEQARRNKWLLHSQLVQDQPFHADGQYQNLWKRRTLVDGLDLVHDAALACQRDWSAEDCLHCLEELSMNYNSRRACSAMLYLSLTWPY